MTVEYTNRKGKTYYLHKGQTKTGKAKYHFSMKAENATKESVPKGFEVYEHPGNAQVFLRKIPQQLITKEEIRVVEKGLKKYSDGAQYKIDVRKDSIQIYTPDQNIDAISAIISKHTKITPTQDKFLQEVITYSPNMQFILLDKDERIFIAKRFCYQGSIDDWIGIGTSGTLNELVDQFIEHLNMDSFFDLL